MKENFLKEAERTVKELEFCRDKNAELSKQNSALRAIIEKRNGQITAYDNKIKQLLLVLAEKQKETKSLERYSEMEKEVESQNEKIRAVAAENASLRARISGEIKGREDLAGNSNELKKIILQKNKSLLEQEKKIDELTRLLIKADKVVADLRGEISSKSEKAERISVKLSEFAEIQKKHIAEFLKKIEESEKQIYSLRTEKDESQKKLAQLFERYSRIKQEHDKAVKMLEEQESRIAYHAKNSKEAEILRQSLIEKEKRYAAATEILRQSAEKIKILETLNRQITLKYEEEKAVLNGMLRTKDEEVKKAVSSFQKIPPITIQKTPNLRPVAVQKSFNPADSSEIRAMVKSALAHGDSIENIKKSLINSGYEKEKIEVVIRKL